MLGTGGYSMARDAAMAGAEKGSGKGDHNIQFSGGGDATSTVPEVYNLDGGSLHGLLDPTTATLNIANATWTAGLIGSLDAVPDQVSDDTTPVRISTTFSNTDWDPHYDSSTINWGDGTTEPLSMAATSTGGRVAPTHTYSHPGLFHALLIIQDPFRSWEGGFAEAAFDVNVISDIQSVVYSDDTAQQVHVTFAAPQLGVNGNWLLLHNLTTGSDYPASSQSFAWDSPASNSGTFSFAGLLPDGDSGHRQAESEAGLGDADFFVWSGDINHDRSVNAADQQIVQANQGLTAATFSQGDLNYDGVVNSDDLAVVATKFGTSLPLPPTPGTITVLTPDSTSARMNWTAVAGALGYRIEMSSDGTHFTLWKDITDPSATTATVPGLDGGNRYWFRLRAFGNGHDTAYTAKVAGTTPMPAPTDVTELQKDNGDIDVTWTDNSNDETGFTLTVTDGTDTQTYDLPANDGSQDQYTLTGLDPDKDWSVSVAAKGPSQNSAAATPFHYNTNAPLAASDLTVADASVAGHCSLQVTWTIHDTSVIGYYLEISTNGSDYRQLGMTSGKPVSGDIIKYLVTDLVSGNTYVFRVRGFNAKGYSAYTRPASLAVPAPAGGYLAPQNSKVTTLSNGDLKYGDLVNMPEVNTVVLGEANPPRDSTQVPEIRGYSIPIPLDGPDSISIDYDLKSYDTTDFGYSDGTVTNFDAFTASVTSQPYLSSAPNALKTKSTDSQFTWGASKPFGDYSVTENKSSTTLQVPHDGTQYYLNLVLDTRNDGLLPSWGTFKFYAANIQVDSNNDGTINAADKQYAQQNPDGPGVIIPVNNDDDDDDGTPDDQETGPISGEDDLVPVKLSVWPQGAEGSVQFSVPSGGDDVDFFKNADASGPLSESVTWDADNLPSQIYAEAIDVSGDGPLQMALNFSPPATTQAATTQNGGDPFKIKIETENVPNGGTVASDWAGTKQNWLVGQMVDLKAVATDAAGKLEDGATYHWTVNGTTLHDYITTNQNASTVPTDTSQQTLQCFWTQATTTGDDQKVIVAVTVAGTSKSSELHFKVYEPESTFHLALGSVGRSRDPQDPTGPHVTFGLITGSKAQGDSQPDGLNYSSSVTLNSIFATQGIFYVTQLITSSDDVWINGVHEQNGTYGQPLTLDHGTESLGDGPTTHDTHFSTGTGTHVFIDQARDGLKVTGLTRVVRTDHFQTTLMFLPSGTGSKPVPLQQVTADWHGGIDKNQYPDAKYTNDWLIEGYENIYISNPGIPPYKSGDQDGVLVHDAPIWQAMASPGYVVAP